MLQLNLYVRPPLVSKHFPYATIQNNKIFPVKAL